MSLSTNPILNRKHQKTWYDKNSFIKIGKRHERRERVKIFIDELKSKPCSDCGKTFPPVCMDFDHARGEKLFLISKGWGRSFESLLLELEKCDLVCSNCHRIRTSARSSIG